MQKLKIFFAVLLTVVTLSHSKPSQAAVGAFVSTPVLIAGLVIGGGAAVGGVVMASKCSPGENQSLCQALFVLIAAPVVLLGIIVLDGEQGVAFQELSNAQAAQIGVSAEDLATYNSEIDQANMLLNDVKEELSSIKKPTEADSQRAWNSLKDFVSPATFSTMQKIVSHQ